MTEIQPITEAPRDGARTEGRVSWVLTGPGGEVKAKGASYNLITRVGNQMYAERGAGLAGAPAAPTGMKLGTSTAAVTKSGTGAALGAYVANSHQAFDAAPAGSLEGDARRVSYSATFAAGKATTATAISEAVIVNEVLTDATSAVAATASRVLLSPPAPKGAADTLTLTWAHDIG